MRGWKKALVLAVAGLAPAAQPEAADVVYVVDSGNSSISFAIRHLVINKVKGSFSAFSGNVVVDETSEKIVAISGEIETASLTTNNEDRDSHLRSPDFFDVEKHPSITFESNEIKKDGDRWFAAGTLTMHGVEREVELPFEVIGTVKDPWGNTRMGVEAELTIDRHDYGITWSDTMDGGGLVVGNDVEIEINVEAVMRK